MCACARVCVVPLCVSPELFWPGRHELREVRVLHLLVQRRGERIVYLRAAKIAIYENALHRCRPCATVTKRQFQYSLACYPFLQNGTI